MPLITSDQIRDISIKTVEEFLNNKIPLSQGLAKQASALQLNSEQIQRSVEATNSIAYIKVLGLADDRTVEFPLCKYAEVMAHVSLPDDLGILKSAGVKLIQAGQTPGKTVAANVLLENSEAFFIKEAAANDRALANLKDRSVTIVPELLKLASAVKADVRGLEKLATVSNDKEFAVLTALVYGENKLHEDTGLFKSAELKEVTTLQQLYKEASELRTAIAEKQALADRAILVKQAFLGAAGAALGKGVAGTMAKPFNMLGRGVGNSISNVTNKVTNSVKGKIGMPVTPMAKKLGLGALAIPAAMTAFDATLYSPGKNKDTGTSKDVWTALQRQ